jgi:hypothetical protein
MMLALMHESPSTRRMTERLACSRTSANVSVGNPAASWAGDCSAAA